MDFVTCGIVPNVLLFLFLGRISIWKCELKWKVRADSERLLEGVCDASHATAILPHT